MHNSKKSSTFATSIIIIMDKLFTKSAFKTALECPTQLYYGAHPDVYANQNTDNDFLKSLAEGGFQVGALAKLYKKVEFDLAHIQSNEEALQKTQAIFAQHDKAVLAEAAFMYDNLFVRADIVEKDGKHIHLIEVKAKSWNPETDKWMGKKDPQSTNADIRPYLYDVAFQKYVLQKALPDYTVHAYLMMADKSKVADVDNLNQLFKIEQKDGRTRIVQSKQAKDILAKAKVEVLTAFDVDEVCTQIIAGETTEQTAYMGETFESFVTKMADAYCKDEKEKPTLGTKCFACPFRRGDSDLKDGHRICWRKATGMTDEDLNKPQIEELWGGARPNRKQWIEKGKYLLSGITNEDFDPHPKKYDPSAPGLDTHERTWLQIALATKNTDRLKDFEDGLNGNSYLDIDGLRAEMETWTYPLHMIDFETTAVALPYYKGMKPYEQVAFQFSHHIIRKPSVGFYTIEHAGQYLNENVNAFPNFEFLRELKRQLEQDKGTIFRYATHENTILRAIAKQLENSSEPDKDELIAFVHSITQNHDKKNGDIYEGERNMVDLLEVVKRYYYNYDEMHGSNSIKKVLPAVLNSSDLLQEKYSQDIYGSEIISQNIAPSSPKHWIEKLADGRVENPYHLLDSVAAFLGISEAEAQQMEDNACEEDEFTVANGGAALTAYSKLMFCNDTMTPALRTSLLRYCELDTLAMVFIWEYFYHEINQ